MLKIFLICHFLPKISETIPGDRYQRVGKCDCFAQKGIKRIFLPQKRKNTEITQELVFRFSNFLRDYRYSIGNQIFIILSLFLRPTKTLHWTILGTKLKKFSFAQHLFIGSFSENLLNAFIKDWVEYSYHIITLWFPKLEYFRKSCCTEIFFRKTLKNTFVITFKVLSEFCINEITILILHYLLIKWIDKFYITCRYYQLKNTY